MCILIIRSWSTCGHMRATSTDKCHTCLATPGMVEYDCPRATAYYPDNEPDWPCPVCHARRRTECGNLLQPNASSRQTVWEIEQAANHSNTSLLATVTSFGQTATDQHTPSSGPELRMPQEQPGIRSNAPSPSPHGSVSAGSQTGVASSDSNVSLRSRGLASPAREATLTTSSSGGINIPTSSTATSNSTISLTSVPVSGSTVTFSPIPSPPPYVLSDVFTIGEDSAHAGDQNISRAPTVYSEAMDGGVPQELHDWAAQGEAILAENGRLSLGHVVLASSRNCDQRVAASHGRAPDLPELEARLKGTIGGGDEGVERYGDF